MGSRIGISNKLPGHATAVNPGTTFSPTGLESQREEMAELL